MMVHKLLLWTESNAFSKSTKCTYKDDLHSHTCSRMFLSTKICSVVPLPCLNPACSFLSFSSTAFLILLTMNLPRSLLVTVSNVTLLQLLHSLRSPFLGSFTNSPFFHLSGILPLSHNWRNNLVSSFTGTSLLALISSTVIRSTPGAFPFFIFLIASLTSSSLITNIKFNITINNSLILIYGIICCFTLQYLAEMFFPPFHSCILFLYGFSLPVLQSCHLLSSLICYRFSYIIEISCPSFFCNHLSLSIHFSLSSQIFNPFSSVFTLAALHLLIFFPIFFPQPLFNSLRFCALYPLFNCFPGCGLLPCIITQPRLTLPLGESKYLFSSLNIRLLHLFCIVI